MSTAERFDAYVAWIDVLGFKQLCGTADTDKLLGEIVESCTSAQRTPMGADAVCERYSGTAYRIYVFQDTIVVVAEVSDPAEPHVHLKNITEVCSRLLYLFLKNLTPVRGALSFGEVAVHEVPEYERHAKGRIIEGRAVIDAYEWEQEQDWVGMIVTPRLEKQDGQEIRRWLTTPYAELMRAPGLGQCEIPVLPWLVQRANVPLRHNRLQEAYAVLPTRNTDKCRTEVMQSIRTSRSALRRMQELAPHDSAKAKYASTLQWLAEMLSKFARGQPDDAGCGKARRP